MKDGLYYIQDTRSVCGNSVVWWRVDGCGYTSNLDEAWRVGREQAEGHLPMPRHRQDVAVR